MIARIAYGGVLEIMLLVSGLGWLYRWLKKRHNKKKCKCCREHEQNNKDAKSTTHD